MVKRTLVVLSVLSLTLMVAGTSFGFIGGGCGAKCDNGPLYVPVDCPDTGVAKTIVSTWECKIEGPCPAPMPGGGSCNSGPRPGMLCSLLTAIAHPCEMLFGGFDGVYGCLPAFGGGAGSSPCGSPFGGGLGGFFGAGTAMLSGESTVFGALW
ncbi:MAG: hypothetical protein V1897_03750 [Pseudomonadota bacterium]